MKRQNLYYIRCIRTSIGNSYWVMKSRRYWFDKYIKLYESNHSVFNKINAERYCNTLNKNNDEEI